MNIVTVCEADDWVDTHLARWRQTLYRHMPDSKCYLIIPYSPEQRERSHREAERLSAHFADIKLIPKQNVIGYAIFRDAIRAHALTAFGLDSVLYMDTDTDVVADISAFDQAPEGIEIVWTPNAVYRDAVPKALKAFGIEPVKPYVEPAVVYMRRDVFKEYMEIVNAGILDRHDYLPSVNAWNVLVRKYIDPAKHQMLPLSYNIMFQMLLGPERPDAHIVHYGGKQGKEMRLYADFREWPERIILSREPKIVDILDWEKGYEG